MRYESTNRRLARPLRSPCDVDHTNAGSAQLSVVARKGGEHQSPATGRPVAGFCLSPIGARRAQGMKESPERAGAFKELTPQPGHLFGAAQPPPCGKVRE